MAYQRINHCDGKVLKTFEELSDKQLETALATAATCFEAGRHESFAARAAVVAKAAAILHARIDELARPVTLEMGTRPGRHRTCRSASTRNRSDS